MSCTVFTQASLGTFMKPCLGPGQSASDLMLCVPCVPWHAQCHAHPAASPAWLVGDREASAVIGNSGTRNAAASGAPSRERALSLSPGALASGRPSPPRVPHLHLWKGSDCDTVWEARVALRSSEA